MDSQQWILSFDAGTSGVKAVLVGLDGHIGGMENAGYSLLRPQTGWAEQRPEEYWQAACAAARGVLSRADARREDVLGVVFSTQWKGMIPLDAKGTVLRNSIIWLDTRAGKQAQELSRAMGKTFTPRDYWTRVMWYREHEPALYAKTACILEANGYLKWKACGQAAIDASNHFTRSFRPATQAFFDEIMRSARLEADKFPPVVASTALVGRVSRQAGAEMGLLPGTPVFGGLCDIPAVAVGAGASTIGAGHLYLGSSGWVGLTRDIETQPSPVPITLASDRSIQVWGLQSVCMSYDWAINTFYHAEKEALGSGIYALVERELSQLPPQDACPLAIPSLFGESAPFPADMRAAFVGVTASHTRAHMVGAVLGGIGCIFKIRKDAIERQAGLKLERLSAVGGGTGSGYWMQLLANMLEAEICVPRDARYAGAVGGAYCAMIGLGLRHDFDECAEKVRIEKRFTPQPEAVARCRGQKERFERLVEALGHL